MTSEEHQLHEVLKTSYFHRQWGDETIASWSFAFVGNPAGHDIGWKFVINAEGEFQRGYLNSVRQRFELGQQLPVSGALLKSIQIEDENRGEILAGSIEGEPFSVYVRRTRPRLRITLGLLRNMVAQLRELTRAPRLLSNSVPDDFLVRSRHGVSLETELHPVFPVLREEESKSDFEIACFWGEYVAGVYGAARDGWEKEVSDYDPSTQRPFRKLLKAMRSGRELGMGDALEELERCLRRETDALRPSTDRIGDLPAAPLGPVRTFLMESLSVEYPEKLARDGGSPGAVTVASPFVLPLKSDPGGEIDRQGALLPPEGWFGESLIQEVNRKMAIPFLSQHPNTLRTRALLCEEDFTLVISDLCSGMPLPALLELKGGVETGEALRIAAKIRRALDQFDSAELQFELQSPWQIEIYLLREAGHAGWKAIVSKPCPEWPVWDIRIRVEFPTEAILEPSENSSWPFLLKRLRGKAFPALLAWMLEWRRLEWAVRERALEREPISWDKRFASLFEAASDHFEPFNPSHRERLLDLVSEGYSATHAD